MNEGIVQHVTPTTQALLRWWFRPTKNSAPNCFHPLQRQALQDLIAAHEAPGSASRTAPPTHRLVLEKGRHQLQTLLAVMVWQLLNHFEAHAAGVEDPRFTQQFLLIAQHDHIRERLLDALRGPRGKNVHSVRDFDQSDIARQASLLIPIKHRARVLDFIRAKTDRGHERRYSWSDGVIAITDARVEALECMARMPNAMVFDDETRAIYIDRYENHDISVTWRRHLRRFASARNDGVHVLFTSGANATEEPPPVSSAAATFRF